MAEQDKALKELDALFHDARAEQPEVSARLMSAILDDATHIQRGFETSRVSVPVGEPEDTTSLWQRLFQSLGGGVGLGGLVTAGLAGVWIGLAPPSFLPDPVDLTSLSTSASDPFDGFDLSELMSEDLQ